jgi:peptidoglycan/xylan/chitin deacetylase (PgdA/CDA1 family)
MANHVIRGLKDGVKRFAHASGGFPAYHALRNERSLTVLAFHRVLPASDPRANDADPDWTISLEHFEGCVAFAREHFNVVSLHDVLEARRRAAPLPPRAMLLTFDDGWADNAQHAVPVLEAAKMPAVIFVASDAMGMGQSMFWREGLRAAWRGGRLDDAIWSALWKAVDANRSSPLPTRNDETLEELLEQLFAKLTRAQREELLARWRSRVDDGRRHMMTPDEVKSVHTRGIAIGAHGRTHEPLSKCENLDDELEEPRRRISEVLGGVPITTLALPHSRFTPDVLHRAERAGYEIVFTGTPELTPTRVIPFTVGRIPITPGAMSDEDGRFRPERLALHLFRRPHVHAWT